MQEWTRFVPCWSTALLPLRPPQDGATQVNIPPTTQVHQCRTLFAKPCAKTVKQTAILYPEPILKSNFLRKNIDIAKTKLPLRKHKKGNTNVNKRKNGHANTQKSKTPKHFVNNNNGVKPKHLRHNVPSTTQVAPLPHATAIGANKKKHFAMKFKRGFINHGCTDKFLHKLDKLLHKLDKNLKFNKSNTTMEILHAKSKLRETILLVKDIIILDLNTMKSNATTSSSSPCPSSTEAMIPKSTFHGH